MLLHEILPDTKEKSGMMRTHTMKAHIESAKFSPEPVKQTQAF
jgi:hypothetical protein